MEIVNLKPSFANRLNQDGFSSLHRALQNEHYHTVKGLVRVDFEFTKVKEIGGISPLHYVTKLENLNFLADCLYAVHHLFMI